MKAAALAVLLVSSPALAQEAAPPAAPPPAPLPSVSITTSPIHLVLPVFEVTTELRVADQVGVAVILGAGSVTPEGETQKVGVFEVGGQGRYYLTARRKHRLHVGAEVAYLYAEAASGNVTATGNGVSFGAFGGYKYTAGIGFTFVAQLGVAATGFAAEDSAGGTASDREVMPLLNLDVGWSF